MDTSGEFWGLVTIAGPVLLAAVLIWAILRNRRSSPKDIERTERATHDLYREEDAHIDDSNDQR